MSLLFHGLNNSDLRSLDLKNVGDRQCVTVHYYKLYSDKGSICIWDKNTISDCVVCMTDFIAPGK
jgi:hypothetical protein